MTLEKLREKNPDIKIYSVFDKEFCEFGRIVKDIDLDDIIKESEKLEFPKEGSLYLPSVESLEKCAAFGEIREKIFGNLDTQLGVTIGYNTLLNATEWHTCSEFNVAVTDLVLILGNRADLKDNTIDSSQMKVFFVPKGCAIECYATTLHFCPCQVSDNGFISLVGLLKGTNVPLETPASDKYLYRFNKWIIAHNDNTSLLERGVMPGISGVNYEIKY